MIVLLTPVVILSLKLYFLDVPSLKLGVMSKFLYFGFCNVSNPWKVNPLNGVSTTSVVQPIVCTSLVIGIVTTSDELLGLVNCVRLL